MKLHKAYCTWCEQKEKAAAVKYAYFERFVADHWPELKLEETNELPICGICAILNEYLVKQDTSIDAAQLVQHMRREHKQLASSEWEAFASLKALAHSPRGDYVLVSIDASPAQPVPHLQGNAEPELGVAAKWITVILSSPVAEEQRMLYVHFPDFWQYRTPSSGKGRPTGCDAWLSVLVDVLRKDVFVSSHPRPRYLLLHLDNTVRALLGLLVLCTV